jgi:hypothetical protein
MQSFFVFLGAILEFFFLGTLHFSYLLLSIQLIHISLAFMIPYHGLIGRGPI